MAADRADIQTLAAKLRGKGLDNAQVAEGLRGMGFSKAEASAAVGAGTAPAPTPDVAKPAATPPAPTAGQQPSTEGGQRGNPTLASLTPKAPDLSSLTLTPPRKLRTEDLGGFFAGLVIYALALSYIRYGPSGPSAWMRAKFLNQPTELADTSADEPGPAPQQPGPTGVPFEATPTGLTSTRPQTPTSI